MSDRLYLIYHSLVLCLLLILAVYDIQTRRVPNMVLILISPVALMSLPLQASMAATGTSMLSVLFRSLTGSATGFSILLVAAMISKNGTGIGGGDIKLAAVMGFIYGPYRILSILMIASLSSALAALVILCRRRTAKLSLPFVPFLAAGSIIAFIIYNIT